MKQDVHNFKPYCAHWDSHSPPNPKAHFLQGTDALPHRLAHHRLAHPKSHDQSDKWQPNESSH